MKGRVTSFQRFGSSLGTTGSVLNKFIRSLGAAGVKKGRDRELIGKGPAGIDESDGKGIYNKTVKSGDDLKYDFENEDFGEEVYGCVASPFGKDALQEKDSQTAIDCRKATRATSPHYEEKKRKWYHKKANKAHEDYVAIPQENVPLTVNSKFPMKYCSRSGVGQFEDDLVIDIPKGIGFTSGALIRPIRFIKGAELMKNGYYSAFTSFGGVTEGQPIPSFNVHHAHILSVPLGTAHNIINCCKEVVLTGSVLHSIERKNMKCKDWEGGDGPDESKGGVEGEEATGCPPGNCESLDQTITATCLSSEQTTVIKLDGDLKMTAYRYKQAADIWEEEEEKKKTLDISGNAFFGGLEEPALRKYAKPYCTFKDLESAIPQPLDDPTLKQVYYFEKQTKLSSGCLSYPITNNSMLVATEEENLKSTRFENPDCETDTAFVFNYLESTASPSLEKAVVSGPSPFFSSNVYEGGQLLRTSYFNEDRFVRPLHVSGPSLFCSFNGIGWDYSQIGKETPEPLYEKDDCNAKLAGSFVHPDWKMSWKSTGIKTTFTGGCPQGFAPLDTYDRKEYTCECPSPLEDCESDPGELKLRCECEGQPCALPEPDHPCQEPYTSKCDGAYGISFAVGKYVGYSIPEYDSGGVYQIAPVPLTTKVDSFTKEDLTLWFSGYISDVLPYFFYGQNASLGGSIYINTETADKNIPEENSNFRYEKKKAGTLTIKCEEWQDTAEIWVVLGIEKETECTTPYSPLVWAFGADSGGINVESVIKLGTPDRECNQCEEPKIDCCNPKGCNGVLQEFPCCNYNESKIANPCNLSFSISGKQECDVNGEKCVGSCVEELDECGCCGCSFGQFGCQADECPPMKSCKELIITQLENLSCYGGAHEEDKHEFTLDLTIEFKLLTETE